MHLSRPLEMSSCESRKIIFEVTDKDIQSQAATAKVYNEKNLNWEIWGDLPCRVILSSWCCQVSRGESPGQHSDITRYHAHLSASTFVPRVYPSRIIDPGAAVLLRWHHVFIMETGLETCRHNCIENDPP